MEFQADQQFFDDVRHRLTIGPQCGSTLFDQKVKVLASISTQSEIIKRSAF